MILLKGGTYCIDMKNQADAISAMLTASEQGHISNYTSDFYKAVNLVLRKNTYGTDEVNNIINVMQKVFCKIEPFTPNKYMVIYRGIKLTGQDRTSFISKPKMIDFGFVSTSTNKDIALEFAESNEIGFVMRIYLLPGVHYKLLPVQKVSKVSFESEIILPNRTIFEKIDEIEIPVETESGIEIYTYVCLPPSQKSIDDKELQNVIHHHNVVQEKKIKANSEIKALNEQMMTLLIKNEYINNDVINDAIDDTRLLIDNPSEDDVLDTYKDIMKYQYGINKIDQDTLKKITDIITNKLPAIENQKEKYLQR